MNSDSCNQRTQVAEVVKSFCFLIYLICYAYLNSFHPTGCRIFKQVKWNTDIPRIIFSLFWDTFEKGHFHCQ